ncbi:arginine--tRNA ligase, partial [Candidatus Roizmanbacteria bacterium]|nr:arginine--tRNA ligase [Candidatus Roizmanbacteria bacterium]
VGEIGATLVKEYLKQGIFTKSQGAIIFEGEKYGLHNRVFINSLGLPTYEAKELGLAPTKYKNWPYDTSIIVTGNEINEYFKVLITALKKIFPDLGKKTYHIGHGMVRLPEGKMSSRTGKIITGESLLNEVVEKAFKVIEKTTKPTIQGQHVRYVSEATVKPSKMLSTAEKVGIASIKYALLKNNIGRDVEFNFEESISFNGNSGPYLQYSFVRSQSVLKHITVTNSAFRPMLTPEETVILRQLLYFPEIVEEAALEYVPSMIATYLFDLAQKYNLFYEKCPILKAEKNVREFRAGLVAAVAQVIKNGLWLLGIETMNEM